MPSEIQIPAFVTTALQVVLAFGGAFFIALWLSLIIWTYRDVRSRSRDVFAIILATLMVVIFGPLGLILYFLLRPPVTLAELYERSLEEEALLQDLEERPRCPDCSRQVKDEWILCPDCHTTLKKICPNCHNGLHLSWNVCPFCGTHVATPAAGHDHDDRAGQVAIEDAQAATEQAQAAVETQPVEIQARPAQNTVPTLPVDVGDQPQMPEVGSA